MASTNRLFFLIFIAFLVQAIAATTWPLAAEIDIVRDEAGTPIAIAVFGELEPGDEIDFRATLTGITSGFVFFDSPGGNLHAGIEIGKAIRLRNLATAVAGGDYCASACALAWLGGTTRVLHRRALLGFHAAYRHDARGVARETGAGNARAGAYLATLGLSEAAIYELMAKGPDDMDFLTPEKAARWQIDVVYVDDDEANPGSGDAVAAAPEPARPTDEELAVSVALANLRMAGEGSTGEYERFIDTYYAETVSYFGKATARSEIIRSARAYKARWPSLAYAVPTVPSVFCRAGTCDVRGEGEFLARSVERNAEARGTFGFHYRVTIVRGHPWIVAEASEVRERHASALQKGPNLVERAQRRLAALGCRPGPVDGIWGPSSQAAMTRFNQANRTAFATGAPSPSAVDAMTGTAARRCSGAAASARFELPWQ